MAFKVGQRVVATKSFKFTTGYGYARIIVPAGCLAIIKQVEGDKYLLGVSTPTMHDPCEFWMSMEEATDLLSDTIEPLPHNRMVIEYDSEQPGYCLSYGLYRVDRKKKDPDLTDSYLVAMRKAWTDWVIEIHFVKGAYYSADTTFRTTNGDDGKECEQFSLLCDEKDGDMLLVQVQIYPKTSRVYTLCYAPMTIDVNPARRKVVITMLYNLDLAGEIPRPISVTRE